MGDDQPAEVLAAHAVDTLGDDLQGVDVEAAVGFVHDDVVGFQHEHLEDLVAFLLATREAGVQVAFDDALVPFEGLEGALELAVELGEADLFAFGFAGLHGEAQEVGDGDAGDLDGVLEGQEDAEAGAFVGFHLEDVLAVDEDFAFGDGVFGVADDDLGQGALAVAVGAHDGVQFAAGHGQVDAFEDGLVADGGVQVADFELVGHAGSFGNQGVLLGMIPTYWVILPVPAPKVE